MATKHISCLWLLAILAIVPTDHIQAAETNQFNGYYSVSGLMGQMVENVQGDSFGSIEDIIISDEGQILYVILGYQAELQNERYVPIPWAFIKDKLISNDSKWVLDIDRQTLANAPSFSIANWQVFAEASWNEIIYTYYNVQKTEPFSNLTNRNKPPAPTGLHIVR